MFTVYLRVRVDDVLYQKFCQHSDLRKLLLNTGNSELIYAEMTDPLWGEGPAG
jgi:predicted NAD-dependent protein-ADP-ribosyltransferase YbiA (DUF1768 family)